MAHKLVLLLLQAEENGELPNTLPLRNRLRAGHQTVGDDHALIARVLKRRIVLFNSSEHHLVPEVLGSDHIPEGSDPLRILFTQSADEDSHEEGHFQPLLPLSALNIQPPSECKSAITLMGPELAGALLEGYKQVENRRFSVADQWVCVHIGMTAHPNPQEILHLCPDLCTKGLKTGCIVGMIHIAASHKLKEYVQQIACKCVGEHSERCRFNPFVIGPVLNVVDASIRFNTSVAAQGSQSKWSLGEKQQEAVRKILAEGAFEMRRFRLPDTPCNVCTWPLNWLPPGTLRKFQEPASHDTTPTFLCVCHLTCGGARDQDDGPKVASLS